MEGDLKGGMEILVRLQAQKQDMGFSLYAQVNLASKSPRYFVSSQSANLISSCQVYGAHQDKLNLRLHQRGCW